MLDDLNNINFDPENYIDQLDDLLDDKIDMIMNQKKLMRNVKS